MKVYDSLYCGYLSDDLESQLKKIYDHSKQMTVQFPRVQQQQGSSDCGLFAIAYALDCPGVGSYHSEIRSEPDETTPQVLPQKGILKIPVIRDLVEQLVLILLLLLSIQIIALFINDYCYFVSCLCTGTYTACHDTAMLHKNLFPLFFSHII